jgi:hypothetical protein
MYVICHFMRYRERECWRLFDVVCRGHVLGLQQRIHLRLLDIPEAAEAMAGVTMELMDCAFDLVDGNVAVCHDA